MRWGLLDGLSEGERRAVLASARRHRFGRREVLFHRGDPADAVHLIGSGSVAVYVVTATGSMAMFDVFGRGEAIGEMALIEPSERTATAIALEPAETWSLRREQFEELRGRHPQIDRVLLSVLAERVRRQNDHLIDAYFGAADQRVARRLAEIAGRMAVRGGARVVRLTQEELAALAGTTRPTANKVLRDLERAGALALRRGAIDVLDLEMVAARAR